MDSIARNASFFEISDEFARHLAGSAEEISRRFEGIDVSSEQLVIDTADSSRPERVGLGQGDDEAQIGHSDSHTIELATEDQIAPRPRPIKHRHRDIEL